MSGNSKVDRRFGIVLWAARGGSAIRIGAFMVYTLRKLQPHSRRELVSSHNPFSRLVEGPEYQKEISQLFA
jgi:hypothetical protein